MSRSPLLISLLAVISWLSAAGLSLAADQRANAVAIPHESSGIGDDDPLAAIAGGYNLQLVFAAQGSGEYLADIKVLIADAKGNTLLDEKSPGPIFFVRLPAGTYRISADFDGMPLRKSVTVSDRRLQNLYFHWPLPASETEKRRP
ncbi:MAG: hypothetical protein H6R17_2811 [Proteobacteria bacterium]|nr:hypothetical protein [Pseudomonadota bacterium]